MRISGVNIPTEKMAFISLTYIYGIGRYSALKILKDIDIPFNKKISDLSILDQNALRSKIGIYKIEGELRRKIAMDIKELMDLGNYKGLRHRRKLPVRGQRTKTNARTRKGRARIPVAAKKKAV
ncbi:MAG: 30S ribosomal protein S13 [Anaplasmataceae bacterium]|nr:30S ribosomal protein S13 [Anaplasmataceae bacterium]